MVLVVAAAGASAPGGTLVAQVPADAPVPVPGEVLGFAPSTDGRLADWQALTRYYERLASTSPRVALDTLGVTTEGRPLVMLVVTSPANQARLDEIREIQAKLADPRRISGARERASLVDRGRAVVLITHGVHAGEVGSAQMAPLLLHHLATSNDPETLSILDEVVVLDVPSIDPDGLDRVVRWYRQHAGSPFDGASLPGLGHAFVGHDLNRDWYALTQAETRAVVRGAHHRWHPHVVHDLHQMGTHGPRAFLPPYVDPWDPNVDPALIAAANQAGTWVAARLQGAGLEGVVVAARYDAYSPGRAYVHYHGGVRVLSETASARLGSPIELDRYDLLAEPGYDPLRSTWNHPDPWPGGRWGLPEIAEYMQTGVLALLDNVARNRRTWLEGFVGVGERAVSGWADWPEAWVLPGDQPHGEGLEYLLRVLDLGQVEVLRTSAALRAEGEVFPPGSYVVPMRQPYAAFAQTLLERQEYPDVREYAGGPVREPYDVTAHTLPLLLGVEAVALPRLASDALAGAEPRPGESTFDLEFVTPPGLAAASGLRIGVYRSWQETTEAGWTRWLLERHGVPFTTLRDADVRAGDLAGQIDVLVLQSQAARSIRNGFAPGEAPPAQAGGLGDEGSRAIRDFVRNGGRVVAIEDATDYVVELFGLGISNAVERLPAARFAIPGSILALDVDDSSYLDEVPRPSVAWYGRRSRAFDVTDPAVRVLARFGPVPLLSGWAVGTDLVAGKPALVQAAVGRGEVVLFGFQPDYRGQSLATWPLLFRAVRSSYIPSSATGQFFPSPPTHEPYP